MSTNKKAIFFVTGLDSGGLENYLLRFLNFKATDFKEVVVFCKGGKTGQLETQFLTIPNVTIKKDKISFFNPLDYLSLYRYFKQNEFNVVCDFTGNFAGLILKVAKLAKIPNRVVFYRGSTDHFKLSTLKRKYNDWVKELVYENASVILSNSQAAFDFFFPHTWKADKRFEIIYNGIDSSQFEVGNQDLREEFGIPESAFIIGHTGRFNQAKNHDVIIEVAIRLVKIYPNIYFILCGNGVETHLKVKVAAFKEGENIKVFENRNDIPIFLNTMDVYFFPSITEGQPNSLIEAMLLGLPFVASNIEPIKETVGIYNKNLFDPNDIDGFFKALEKLYSSKIERNNLLKIEMSNKFNHRLRFNEFYNKLV